MNMKKNEELVLPVSGLSSRPSRGAVRATRLIDRIGFFPMLLGTASLLAAAPAIAQEGSADSSDDFSFVIEEVIVTAKKRESNLKDEAVSAVAFGRDKILDLGMDSLSDLSARSGPLNIPDFTDLKLGPTTLRGVFGSTFTAAQEDPVAKYVDEVFLGSGASSNIELFDIQRIEVLRGPQGTFFGRNSVGGAIVITTNRPVHDFAVTGLVEFGNYDHRKVEAVINVPVVTDTLAVRLAAQYRSRDGYEYNEFLDERVNSSESKALRGSLLYTPSDAYEAFVSIDYRDVGDQYSNAHEVIALNDEFPPVVDPATGEAVLGPDGNPIPDVTGNLFLAGVLGFLGGDPVELNTNPTDRVVRQDQLGVERLDGWGLALRQQLRLSDTLDLVSVSSYREHEYFNIGDSDASPLQFVVDGSPETAERFSQELRVSCDCDNGLAWTVGGYYYYQNTDNGNTIQLGPDIAPVLVGNPNVTEIDISQNGVVELNSYAAFAHISYPISSRLTFELGGRYTYETKSIDYTLADPTGFVIGPSVQFENSENWSAFTPSFALSMKWTEDLMTYAKVSKAYKSGGFNDGLGASQEPFGPEELWSYELGVKLAAFDQRLSVNLDVFQMDWSELQLRVDNLETPQLDIFTTNAGSAKSRGVELETVTALFDHLMVGFNYSYVDLDYDDSIIAGLQQPLKEQVYSPKHTINLFADYYADLGNWGEAVVSGEWIRKSRDFLTVDGRPNSLVPGHSLLNARVKLDLNALPFDITFWGENLTDKVVMNRIIGLINNPLISQDLAGLSAPRRVGVRLNFEF
ncbi:TonB-dependent receptor [Kordiimonas lacus]|uniref:TonB-dependent Receptor Plug Domain n=1 Tax=Kordiimonas lacus TaxID=637679 RepID=A0A1G7F5N1_9PROT|nr:TonB-dependent receptor [Kordiimonas lacus]SDE71192.1 TonB-dependent Receptor Plug Domain [Kordiimonas lacus]